MKIIKSTVIIITCLLAFACKKDSLRKSGNIVSETRSLVAFESISSKGSNPVIIRYGNKFEVVLKGSDNLLPHFQTKVVGKELQLGFDISEVKNDDIEIFVTLPILNGVKVNGSSEVEISGTFGTLEQLDIQSNGSSKITAIDNLKIDNLSINLSGSGRINFENALATNSNVVLSGSGNIIMSTISKLKVAISGSGTVSYRGNPALETQITGSGKVLKL